MSSPAQLTSERYQSEMKSSMYLGIIAICILITVIYGVQAQPASLHKFDAALPSSNSEFARAMMDSMTKMDRDMMAAPMICDPDHDFAAMMIPHHQGAIDMAKGELLYGKDPSMRRLAQEIITDQQLEIELME